MVLAVVVVSNGSYDASRVKSQEVLGINEPFDVTQRRYFDVSYLSKWIGWTRGSKLPTQFKVLKLLRRYSNMS